MEICLQQVKAQLKNNQSSKQFNIQNNRIWPEKPLKFAFNLSTADILIELKIKWRHRAKLGIHARNKTPFSVDEKRKNG